MIAAYFSYKVMYLDGLVLISYSMRSIFCLNNVPRNPKQLRKDHCPLKRYNERQKEMRHERKRWTNTRDFKQRKDGAARSLLYRSSTRDTIKYQRTRQSPPEGAKRDTRSTFTKSLCTIRIEIYASYRIVYLE